uniref:Uncharacterized protein n=1 Tax=Oryza glumipatula TaxID=40148 RepID=A0A0E0A9A9_9ORYZ
MELHQAAAVLPHRRPSQRRPPPLPPRPVAARDARAFPPPVDARARSFLPIDDGARSTAMGAMEMPLSQSRHRRSTRCR